VRHRTLLNLSDYPEEDILAIELALKNKKNIHRIEDLFQSRFITRHSIGGVFLLNQIAKETGIYQVLGNSKNGKIILWQVLSRLIQPTSKLGSVRLAREHAVLEVLKMDAFNENDVYESMNWLNEKQTGIELKLYKGREKKNAKQLFLYDVTSSYFEGEKNEMAAYGYNRDKKKGKKQIVIGLLTDEEGIPVSVQVYEGNTQDVNTLADQIEKACSLFEVSGVIFVGDKGMIKTEGQEKIRQHQFSYITGITKAQIETLLKKGIFQMSLFDGDIHEITGEDGVRYILRRNPLRQQEIEYSKQDKLVALKKFIEERNRYLNGHKRAKESVALKNVIQKANRLKISRWTEVQAENRTIMIKINRYEYEQDCKLDGCYVIKTDVVDMQAQLLHDRYKDLSKVEQAFKDYKTKTLEVRPIFLRNEERTRAHVFVVMLSYMIYRKLEQYWKSEDITVKEGVQKLSKICIQQIHQNQHIHTIIPEPDQETANLLRLSKTVLPKTIKLREKDVYTTVKLNNSKKS
jgi:transposase